MNNNFEIIRKTDKGFTRVPNAILRDGNLTSDAKVIIYFLLSLTKSKNGYHLTTQSIISTVHISKSRVEKAIELLQKTGYLSIEKVKDGNRYGGYKWLISDVSGAFRNLISQSTENRDLGNPEYGNSVVRKTESSEIRSTEIEPTYELPNNELPNKNNQDNERLTDEQPIPLARAGGEVTSQKEYLYQQFLKRYPKKPTGTDAAATKQAFFDIPDLENIFDTIMAGVDEWCNSIDWNKEGGRYITKPLNFITTQKWEEIPRGISTEIDPGLAKFFNVPLEVYL